MKKNGKQKSRIEKVFLSERFMTIICMIMVAAGLVSFVFCLMYQDAYLALARLWAEQNYDVYLISGVQGSLFLAGASMNQLMTAIITVNHFFINYSTHGNPKNVIFNRIALVFKFAVCILLIGANSQLGFSTALHWARSTQYLMDIALLMLVACLEAQFDSFNALRKELRNLKQERTKKSARERISGIWLMSMTLLALFAFTCYFVAQMRLNILQTAYFTLAVLQGAALTVYMWGPEKLKFRWQRVLYRLLYASSFFVIPAPVGRHDICCSGRFLYRQKT